jgi:L-alanine-DL-glutamate epimerase-like enolase superfamily enzyme
MKITALRTARVEIPIEPPLKTSIHQIRSVGCVLVFLDTDEGLVGEGYTFTLSAERLDVLDALIKSLEPIVVGCDPFDVEAIWRGMWNDIHFIGRAGLTIFALSAIDTACWDIIGKATGKPLYKLFGGCRESIKTYASGGLWLSLSVDELVAEAKGFIDQGFRAMKARLGKPNIDEDIERIAAIRDAIGPDIDLMADANQGLTVDHAIRLGRKLEEFKLVWFEEPVPTHDHEGHAAIAAALDTPIASGETEYTHQGIKRMIDAKAADILMPDLQRMGGLTEFRKVAALAEAHDIPVSPHIFSEQSLAIAGSAPNCNYLEYMPWFEPLYNEAMTVDEGMVAMPDRPGIGFTFNMDAVDRYRIG